MSFKNFIPLIFIIALLVACESPAQPVPTTHGQAQSLTQEELEENDLVYEMFHDESEAIDFNECLEMPHAASTNDVMTAQACVMDKIEHHYGVEFEHGHSHNTIPAEVNYILLGSFVTPVPDEILIVSSAAAISMYLVAVDQYQLGALLQDQNFVLDQVVWSKHSNPDHDPHSPIGAMLVEEVAKGFSWASTGGGPPSEDELICRIVTFNNGNISYVAIKFMTNTSRMGTLAHWRMGRNGNLRWGGVYETSRTRAQNGENVSRNVRSNIKVPCDDDSFLPPPAALG